MTIKCPLTVKKLRELIDLFGTDVIPDWDKFLGPTNRDKPFHRPECLCDHCLAWIITNQQLPPY
jgi:hypothetical protein